MVKTLKAISDNISAILDDLMDILIALKQCLLFALTFEIE